MKKNHYIQPTIEVARLYQTVTLCASNVIDGEVEGGTEIDPTNI